MTKILMATDGSEHAAKVFDETIRLARALDADVGVLSVAEILDIKAMGKFGSYLDEMKKEVQAILDQAKKQFADEGLTVETIFSVGHPSAVICAVAEEGKYDLIVLGSRGLGKIKEMILGSVSNRVAHCAKVSVYIVK